jgi:hypothetical protein
LQQTSWIKENLFIVAAVVLPLAVAALFLLATALPRYFVDDPSYALLVAIDERLANRTDYAIEFEVTGDRLKAKAVHSTASRFFGHSELFRYTPGDEALEHIPLEIPGQLRARLESELQAQDKQEARLALPLPAELANLELMTAVTAPDGYRFRNDFRGSPGLFGALFGMGSRYRVVAIEKDGRVVEIGAELEGVQGYSHYNVQFLGWIAVEQP